MAEMVGCHRVMMLGPSDATGRPTVAAELVNVDPTHVDLLRRLLGPNLGAGVVLMIDGDVVARGPDSGERQDLAQVQRLTEMAVQQHEYLCAELRRMRDEYEQEFAQERVILRTLRQRWLERICDDQVRGEDMLRFLVESARSAAKKAAPKPGDG